MVKDVQSKTGKLYKDWLKYAASWTDVLCLHETLLYLHLF